MLGGVNCWLVTDVSEQPIGPNFKVTNHQLMPHNIPETQRPQVHRGESLKSPSLQEFNAKLTESLCVKPRAARSSKALFQ